MSTPDLNALELHSELGSTVAEVINLAASVVAAQQQLEIADTPATILPPGYTLTLHPELRERPRRTARTYSAHTVDSFIDYVNRYADEDTTVFIDLARERATAIIDYDAPTAPADNGARWGAHRAAYDFPRTNEADDWLRLNGRAMTQQEFALFIEQHLPEIVEPDGATMLEIALSLQAKTSVEFAKAARLDNGQVQFQYRETIDGSAGPQGNIQIPSEFKLGLQLFKGGAAYELAAKLRYRIKEGQLVMWYDLIRPQRAIEDAITTVAEQIRSRLAIGHLVFGEVADGGRT